MVQAQVHQTDRDKAADTRQEHAHNKRVYTQKDHIHNKKTHENYTHRGGNHT